MLTHYPRCASRSRQQLPNDTAWSQTLVWLTQTMRSRLQSASSPLSEFLLYIWRKTKSTVLRMQVWPQWEEQAQVYGAVDVCTRWRDQPRHPGLLLSLLIPGNRNYPEKRKLSFQTKIVLWNMFMMKLLQWKEIDQNDLMDSKLRCVFAMPPAQVIKICLLSS